MLERGIEELREALDRVLMGSPKPDDVEHLQQAIAEGKTLIFSGERRVSNIEDARGATVITGDQASVSRRIIRGDETHGDKVSGDKNVINIQPNDYERLIQQLQKVEYSPPEHPPDEILADRGGLPPGSRMIYFSNDVFTGREKDMIALAKGLLYEGSSTGNGTSRAAVVTGIGGMGKTQLAVEFCYRYGRFFRGVHWLNAKEDVSAEIADCGQAMRLDHWPEVRSEQVHATLAHWSSSGPRLVMLDNAEDPEPLQEWLPRLQGVRILLTARRAKWPKHLGLKLHRLSVLARGESLELLQKLAPRLEEIPEEELDLIADRLGDLPLALDLAGRYLEDRPDLSPADYLAELEGAGGPLRHLENLLGWVRGSPTNIETSLEKIFVTSRDRLQGDFEEPLAIEVFTACGYCAPNAPIPLELLAKAVRKNDPKGRQEFDRALRRLYELGLLTPTDNFRPSIHPLLSEFAQQGGISTAAQAEEAGVLSRVAEVLTTLTKQAYETGLPADFARLRPHLEVVARRAQRAGLDQAAVLWNELGVHLCQIAEFAAARNVHESALAIDEAAHGSDHPNVARDLGYLGRVLKDLGDPEGAEEANKRALEIDETHYGPNHPKVAIRVNDLGFVIKDKGDREEAKGLFERALSIDEKHYGPDHPAVARDSSILGFAMKDLGDLEGAEDAFERALEIDKTHYGPDHPNVAIRVNDLGFVLKDKGDQEEAKRLFEHALSIDEEYYGPDHPAVARDSGNLGFALKDLGDLEGAKEAFERALELDERLYGPDHPSVAMRLIALGFVLQDKADREAAKKIFERALKIDEKHFGPDHPTVARDSNNLGIVLRDLEQLENAKAAFERALKIDEKHFGSDHPAVERDSRNLQLVVKNMEDL